MAGKRRVKGTGGVYQRSSDGMWCGSVELPCGPDGMRRRKVIVRAKKTDVLLALREARKELDKAGNLTTSSPTLAQWCDLWWERYGMSELKVSTRPGYQTKIERHIKPAIGRIRLDRLTVDHVYVLHRFITETRGASPATAQTTHAVLSSILRDAEREGRISRNVARIAARPKAAKPKKEYLDSIQARALLGLVAGDLDLSARWGIALMGGLRQGERLGLAREHIDLDSGLILVRQQLKRLRPVHGCLDDKKQTTCGKKTAAACPQTHLPVPPNQTVTRVHRGLYLTPPKAAASVRVVPMLGLLRDTMAAYLEQHEPGMHGLIFTKAGGAPLDPQEDSKDWRNTLAAAGLPPVSGHSARHTCNTILTELDVPVDVRMKYLGHASRVVNEETYTHTSDARVLEAGRTLAAALDYRSVDGGRRASVS